MNIALIGAPGSGKSGLAYRLAHELHVYDPNCGCGERTVKIVDHYAPEIERKANLALGAVADYSTNLYVALERYALEQAARADHQIVITCGTLIETAVYTAMQFVSLAKVLDEVEKFDAAPRIEATLRILACFYNDLFHYDYAFYLPPADRDDADTQFIDQQLQAALQGFKLIPVTALLDAETRVQDALAALGKKNEVPAS